MKILAVSLAFPPLAYPRSIQVARLLRHLDAETVLLCADEPGARLDDTIEPAAEADLKACIRIPVRKSRLSAAVNAAAYRVSRPIWNRRNMVPDQYRNWGKAAVQVAVGYLRESGFQPDRIVTFAQPFTDHLIGADLKARLGIPWLAYFSDPWTDNPFAGFDTATRKANLELEALVTEKADALVFTSEETVELYFRKYKRSLREKAHVVPQCFDPEQFPPPGPNDPQKITVRYLGNFYGKRTPAPLIEALGEISRKDPAALEGVSIELVGFGDGDEVRRLSHALPPGLVLVRGSVSYIESLRLMKSSDGLLLIDAPADLSVFLPSKLIDYIGSGKPIFGVTPPGTAASLIDGLGGNTADPADPEALSIRFAEFISYLRVRRSASADGIWGKTEVRAQFAAPRIAAEFGKILENLA